jgi:hypothetical protein
MILYLKDNKNSTNKTPCLINTFGNVAVYKINIKISMFSKSNHELTAKEQKFK